jgi:hypothetical protein
MTLWIIISNADNNERRETMLESKRKFKRFDLPLIVKFRLTNGKTAYSLGLLKNISCEGLSLEARDFNFLNHENLELELKFPQGNASVSLLGDVMWKKQDGRINYAGIKFQGQNESSRNEIIEKISYHTNIPIENFFNSKDIYYKGSEKKVPSGPSAQKNDVSVNQQPPSLIKQFPQGGATCSVTFRLSKEAAGDAQNVTVAGDFNNWDIHRTQMIKLNNGDFSVTLELTCNKEYKFKYLIDGKRWENDWHADKYVPNAFGAEDSVVIT